MAVLYNPVHFSLMILLHCAEEKDQKSWACLFSPVKLAIFSLNPKQIATKGFFAFLLRTSIPI